MRALRLPLVPRVLRALGGLRVRLVVAFTLVTVVATVTTGVLTFREARRGVLQQSQDAVIEDFRHRVDTLAPNYRFPPDEEGLRSFVTDVARGGPSQGWRVLAVRRGTRVTSVPGDAFRELSPGLSESVRTRRATVFQRVTRQGRSSLVVGLPVTFAGRYPTEGRASGLEVHLTVPQQEEQGYVDALVSAIERATVPALVLAVLVALLAARGVLCPDGRCAGPPAASPRGTSTPGSRCRAPTNSPTSPGSSTRRRPRWRARWRNCAAWRRAHGASPPTSRTNCAPRWPRWRR